MVSPVNTSTAYVLYQNLLIDSSLSASSTQAGSHVQNAIDWRTTTFWTPDILDGESSIMVEYAAPVSADSFAIYRHNCAAAECIVTVQAWDDVNELWIDRLTLTDLNDDQCFFKMFALTESKKWRVLFDTSDVFYVGVLMLGKALHLPFGMPVGFTPPRHNPTIEKLSSRTVAGQFVGRSIIRRGSESELTQKQISPSWLRQFGEPFIRHAEKYPFIFSWSYIKYPDDAVFCQAKDIDANPYKDQLWQSLKMTLECLP